MRIAPRQGFKIAACLLLLLMAHLGYFLRHWRIAVARDAAIATCAGTGIDHQRAILAAGVQKWRVADDRPDNAFKFHRGHAVGQALDGVASILQILAGDLKHAVGTVADDEEHDALALLRQISCNVQLLAVQRFFRLRRSLGRGRGGLLRLKCRRWG